MEWIVNPLTQRLVKNGSQTHRRLVNQGVLKNTQIDEKVLTTYDPDTDDIEQLKEQLQPKLSDNEIVSIGKGRYKNKLVRSFKGNKGRPTSKRPIKSNIDSYVNSLLQINKDEEDTNNHYSYEELTDDAYSSEDNY
jgi:hypothetical protein